MQSHDDPHRYAEMIRQNESAIAEDRSLLDSVQRRVLARERFIASLRELVDALGREQQPRGGAASDDLTLDAGPTTDVRDPWQPPISPTSPTFLEALLDKHFKTARGRSGTTAQVAYVVLEHPGEITSEKLLARVRLTKPDISEAAVMQAAKRASEAQIIQRVGKGRWIARTQVDGEEEA